MRQGWFWVVLGGIFEIGFTTSMMLAKQDSRWWGAFLVCCILSFEFLSRALKSINVGVAYAVWTGIGSVGTVLVGAVFFGEPFSVVRGLLLVGLIAAMIGLKMTTRSKQPDLSRSGSAGP
ncbi:QacE family quaternary ammonium compound efflux SMR transporter [Enemella evansiae]|uniref:DMT family transporter n=1 Tax=Enemella evansiae TaxID=2016499 RepID=UPI000B9617DE|nr:multidrug efflux SMR transporter [Enemella evansiae]OYN99744.1 QacE family quaternary ammonium compound efflux SMR transporter [Enemella evansiae]